jgi:L-rhamnose-H+ transport protein
MKGGEGMNLGIFFGAALILAGGILQGTFAVPMKYARKWSHENIWLVFCFTGMVAFPWILTAATVPSLAQVYASTAARTLWLIVLCGLLWGVGATLTGIGLRLLGIGLGFAVILGLSASVGSMVPLLVLTPEKIFSPQGIYYLVGTLVMFGGIALVAVAGSLREKAGGAQGRPAGSSFVTGLLVCIASGVLSSLLNFGYAFGAEAIENARRLGASPVWASGVAAAPTTTGGFVANLLYCAWNMRRNHTFSRYWIPGAGGHWLLGLTMGAFWYGGLAAYGMGIFRMGAFGTVAGWSLLMGAIMVSSNVAGLATGEWRHAGRRAKGYLFAGSAVILAAIGILSMAQGS